MSNPWKKDECNFDYVAFKKQSDKLVEQIENKFGKMQSVKIRTDRDHEIGKHCIRAIKDFAHGKIKQDEMWAIIDNRHAIVPATIDEKEAHH